METFHVLPKKRVRKILRSNVLVPKFRRPYDLPLVVSRFCILFTGSERSWLDNLQHHHWWSRATSSCPELTFLQCTYHKSSERLPELQTFPIFFSNNYFKSTECVTKFRVKLTSSGRLSAYHCLFQEFIIFWCRKESEKLYSRLHVITKPIKCITTHLTDF